MYKNTTPGLGQVTLVFLLEAFPLTTLPLRILQSTYGSSSGPLSKAL